MADCAAVQSLTVGGQTVDAVVRVPGPCTSYVLVTPAEHAALSGSLLNLSIADGALLAFAVIAVWAIAWGFRALYRTLDFDSGSSQE